MMCRTILCWYFTFFLLLSSLKVGAQCYPDRHNTTWFDAWISCRKAPNPNPQRDSSHWILYDFGELYEINSVHFWNLNAPNFVDDGVRRMAIDVSRDGMDWREVGVFSVGQAPALSRYEGEELQDFPVVVGRYVLITVLESWGGACAGFSEIRFGVDSVITTEVRTTDTQAEQPWYFDVSPNPSSSNPVIVRVYYAPMGQYTVEDVTGRLLTQGRWEGAPPVVEIPIDLPPQRGTFVIKLRSGKQVQTRLLIRL